MKTNHTKEQLQSAIDAAFSNPDRARMLATRPGYEWNLQAPCRMKIAHEFIEHLPEPPPPVVDGKTPGEVFNNAIRKLVPERFMEWCMIPEADKAIEEEAMSAVLAAFGNKPASFEAAIARMENVFAEDLSTCFDDSHIISLAALQRVKEKMIAVACEGQPASQPADAVMREGFRPAVDWKAKFEKAEAELARIVAAAHEADWNGVENSKDLAQFIKDQAEEVGNRQAAILAASTQIDALKAQSDRWFNQAKAENEKYLKAVEQIGQIQQPQLSTLRPISEAGEVPAGCVRIRGFKDHGEWHLATWNNSEDTHCADIRLPEASPPAVKAKKEMPVGLNSALDVWPDEPKDRPAPAVEAEKPDPYAELKAAHAKGKAIQVRINGVWMQARHPQWQYPVGTYRVDPDDFQADEPTTFEAHGKTWTRHTPGDPMPCDGERMVVVVVGKHDQPESLPQKGSYWLWTSKVFNCIGWRYADEPTLAPDKPWTPAVGDVVTLKSGGPKMTVMRPAKGYDGELIEGELACMWATEADSHMIHANPATLQPA